MSHTHLLSLGEAGVKGANGYGEGGRVFQVAATCLVKTKHELPDLGYPWRRRCCQWALKVKEGFVGLRSEEGPRAWTLESAAARVCPQRPAFPPRAPSWPVSPSLVLPAQALFPPPAQKLGQAHPVCQAGDFGP